MDIRFFLVLGLAVIASGYYIEDERESTIWDQDQEEPTYEVPSSEVYIRIDPTDDFEWIKFKETYNKTYKDVWEEGSRRLKWEDNVKMVNKHNEEFLRGEHSFWVGIQEHSDMSLKEVMDTMTGLILPEDDEEVYPPALEEDDPSLPSTVNWKTMGAVTPVQNQGRCGSCWAFSAVGALEGQTKLKTGRLPNLSEQNLVDCSKTNYGCHGGLMNRAFQYVLKQGGIDNESCYHYTARQSNCKYKPNCKGSYDKGYENIGRNEKSLKQAVANKGPMAIAVDVSSWQFSHYKAGVFDYPACGKSLNHAMLAVGYGREGSKDYWLIKNSWGMWGDRGYIKMRRNANNQCGIGSYASYPKL